MYELYKRALEKAQKAEGLTRHALELWEQGRIDGKELGRRIESIKRKYRLTPEEQDALDTYERRAGRK